MARIPWAAKQLIKQVKEIRPNATAEPFSEPDGFGVRRSIRFDPATSEWLEPILAVELDPRITATGSGHEGLIVQFSAGTRADQTYRFKLAEVDRVLNEPGEPLVDEVQPEEQVMVDLPPLPEEQSQVADEFLADPSDAVDRPRPEKKAPPRKRPAKKAAPTVEPE